MRAQELLRNDLFRESIDALRSDLIQQMQASNLGDMEGHTRLVMALQMTGAIDRYLRNVIHDGEQASISIQVRGQRID